VTLATRLVQRDAKGHVSLKEISICVVDADGNTVARGVSPADPGGVAGWLGTRSLSPKLIVHESGQLSIWLQRGLERLGLPATCVDARKAHKGLSARPNKSDAAPKVLHNWCMQNGRSAAPFRFTLGLLIYALCATNASSELKLDENSHQMIL